MNRNHRDPNRPGVWGERAHRNPQMPQTRAHAARSPEARQLIPHTFSLGPKSSRRRLFFGLSFGTRWWLQAVEALVRWIYD